MVNQLNFGVCFFFKKNIKIFFIVNVPDSIINPKSEISTPLVQILDPSSDIVPVKVVPDPQESTRFMVVYTPMLVGNHQVYFLLNIFI